MQSGSTTPDWPGWRGDKWQQHLEPMEAMLHVVDEPLVAALDLDDRCRVADIGCGGGHTSRSIARAAPTGSVVHGYDINARLVRSARERAGDLEVEFQVADAEQFRPERRYDRLASRFGVMFFADPHAAFANLRHWLNPGGRFAFAVWGAARDNPWVTVVRDVIGRIVDLPAATPDAPGPFRYGEDGALERLLREVGFAGVSTEAWSGRLAVGGGLDAAASAEFCLAAYSTLAELLARAGAAAHERAHAALTRALQEHEHDGRVTLPCRVAIVRGERGP
ncbi:MAG: class I SAM-dependent methyltransferase [Myxococcota bacterium]